jgi:hypothetical protein
MSDKPIPERWREDMLNPQHYRLPVCIEELGAAEARIRELELQLQEARSVIEELCDGIEDGGGTDGNGDTFDLRRSIAFLEADKAVKNG